MEWRKTQKNNNQEGYDRENLLTMEDVGFSYGSTDGLLKKRALNKISLSIKRGKVYLICGSSGCGKTTLIRHMKKELIPFGMGTGNIKYNGVSIFDMKGRESAEKIGYVSQNPESQIVTDKVWHELAFGMESLGVKIGAMEARVAEVSQYFGIESWYGMETDNLSGGQKQILNLAAAMAENPELLLLDEPTSQLAPVSAGRFFSMVSKINRELGTTIVMTEQRLEEAWPLADFIIVMEHGEIISMAPPALCGNLLYRIRREEDKNISIWEGLPASMRLYYDLEEKASAPCPLTVREGREYLSDFISGKKYNINEESDRRKNNKCGNKIKRTGSIVLSAKNVYFGYEKNEYILKDFELKAKRGEIIGILGGNGAGKTTALKVLGGIYPVKKGKVAAEGRICYLPQEVISMFTEATVKEELKESGASMGEIKKMLDFMGLAGHTEQNPYDLSGGEAQRLALGKLLLRKPDILLLDEPTKGIDPCFKKKLGETMRELCIKGMTLIMVSHDVEFTAEYAGCCGLLFQGKITAFGDTHSFFMNFNLYTTKARLISRGILPENMEGHEGFITIEELAGALKDKEKI